MAAAHLVVWGVGDIHAPRPPRASVARTSNGADAARGSSSEVLR